jgi:hypothetical protein
VWLYSSLEEEIIIKWIVVLTLFLRVLAGIECGHDDCGEGHDEESQGDDLGVALGLDWVAEEGGGGVGGEVDDGCEVGFYLDGGGGNAYFEVRVSKSNELRCFNGGCYFCDWCSFLDNDSWSLSGGGGSSGSVGNNFINCSNNCGSGSLVFNSSDDLFSNSSGCSNSQQWCSDCQQAWGSRCSNYSWCSNDWCYDNWSGWHSDERIVEADAHIKAGGLVGVASVGSDTVSDAGGVAPSFGGWVVKHLGELGGVVGSAALVSLQVEVDLGVESLSGKHIEFLLLLGLDELLGGVGQGGQETGGDSLAFSKFSLLLLESEIFSLEFHLELGVHTLLSDVALDVEELLVKSELEGSYLSSLVERC